MWEDPSNAKGGKWVVLFRSCPHLLDWAWANLTMGLIGDVLDEEDQVTGVVGSCRPKMDRIQIWTRGRGLDDGKDGDVSDGGGQGVKDLNDLGRRIWEMMRLEGEVENVSIEFQVSLFSHQR
jgi:translation initiation factor 4E